MLDPDIAAQIQAFDQALTERLDDTNFIIDDFGGFGMKDEGSDMPQWDTGYPAYGDENTTPTETEYCDMIEEPPPDVDSIGSFDKYIVVMIKLDDKTNSGGNIATVKRRGTDENIFANGRAHIVPLLDTIEYEADLEYEKTDRYFDNVITENVHYRLDNEGH